MTIQFSEPDAETVGVPKRLGGDRSEWWELVSQEISARFEGIFSLSLFLKFQEMASIADRFQIFKAAMPTIVARELYKRWEHIPEKFREYNNSPSATESADRIQDVLDDLANRPPDEELGEEILFAELEAFDEFERAESPLAVLWLRDVEVKGRFMRLDKLSTAAVGLKESSHPGKIVDFHMHYTRVKKVIRR